MADAKYVWRRTRARDTIGHVGRFFECLLQSILGGETSTDGSGDLVDWSVPAAIEIKASDNNHTLRILRKQLETHECIGQGFPFEWFLYCLCTYKNTRTPGGKTPLRKCRGAEEIQAFLASHIDTVYLLDIRIIRAYLNKHGPRTRRLPCEPHEEVIELHRRYLKEFTNGQLHSELATLGLNPKEWVQTATTVTHTVQIGMYAHPVSFTLIKVIHSGYVRRLKRRNKNRA